MNSVAPHNLTLETLDVVVDYDMTLEEMIEAGNYDSRNKDINIENFHLPSGGWGLGKVHVSIKLLCFNKFMEFEEILYEVNSSSLRPGMLPELLAIGAQYPDKQREFPIIQVGSIWMVRGFHRGVYLRRANKERMLSKIWLNMGFSSFYRIIAVEMQKPH